MYVCSLSELTRTTSRHVTIHKVPAEKHLSAKTINVIITKAADGDSIFGIFRLGETEIINE